MPSATPLTSRSIIPNRSVDTVRPLKVICIGAGVSGILAAINLPQVVRKLDLVIYDKNEELGGTWFENKYPGCACDIPAHCYQLSFESNPAWTSFYAKAPEILEYWKRVAEKYDCRQYMKLGYKALEARWNEGAAKWRVKLENVKTGVVFEDQGDALITAIGALNEWRWPPIPGLHGFGGKLLHSAAWDESYDYNGKQVAVIGAGSSGIQIVPSLQPEVQHLDHYIRGRTWIAGTFARGEIEKRHGAAGNFDFTEEEKDEWRKDPASYLTFRKNIEAELQGGHNVIVRGSDAQKDAREYFTQSMRDRLGKKPEVADHILPDFPPLCKRLTPGPGYLEALTADNVSVIPTSISHVTSTGIAAYDGTHRPVDAIVCATGFDTSFLNRFPVYGINGTSLIDRWSERTSSYLSMMVDSFPNYFMSVGPNSALGTGNFIMILERQSTYFASCLAKIQTQNILSMQPKPSAVNRFANFCDEYFKGTVFSEDCSSWYKSGKDGRVTALWPGSSLHAIQALDQVRWEDFDYEYVDGNEFGWFGDGWSERDRSNEISKTYYLDRQGMLDWPLDKTQAIKNGHGAMNENKDD
ncbi:hypothetical protein HO173_009200 [Letharia columbiana]|uniref:Flavin-binding monooxygenase n=1 Tax=Letharia columbiana TaxID=112416 RepID=A0A8H6FPV0_9LECA|nr:uncharacterized protein HO173_009200 [Letharia columbiana]KAF6232532.1 hypothetical protein HO173_009200 [Letharia columbiana]